MVICSVRQAWYRMGYKLARFLVSVDVADTLGFVQIWSQHPGKEQDRYDQRLKLSGRAID